MEQFVLQLSKLIGLLRVHAVVFSLGAEVVQHFELLFAQLIDHLIELCKCADLGLNEQLLVLSADKHFAQRVRVFHEPRVLRLGHLSEEVLDVAADD